MASLSNARQDRGAQDFGGGIPSLGIGEHWFARLDAKGNEINRALFPRQPVWNARRSAHGGLSDRRLTETAYNQFVTAPNPADLAAFVLFFQPAH